jgi:hypothetical protein
MAIRRQQRTHGPTGQMVVDNYGLRRDVANIIAAAVARRRPEQLSTRWAGSARPQRACGRENRHAMALELNASGALIWRCAGVPALNKCWQ